MGASLYIGPTGSMHLKHRVLSELCRLSRSSLADANHDLQGHETRLRDSNSRLKAVSGAKWRCAHAEGR